VEGALVKIGRVLGRLKRTPNDFRFAIGQRWRWGRLAPRRGEVIAVDPREVRGYLHLELASRLRALHGVAHGGVVDGDWELEVDDLDITETAVFKSCALRWQQGYRWQDTPVYQEYVARIESGALQRYGSEKGLLKRYERLDAIYEQVLRAGAMSAEPAHLIRMNLTRSGRFIYGPDGRHRFVMALLAGLETMPSRVGLVHPEALDRFRAVREASSGRTGA
jgi:hypothetical protein